MDTLYEIITYQQLLLIKASFRIFPCTRISLVPWTECLTGQALVPSHLKFTLHLFYSD